MEEELLKRNSVEICKDFYEEETLDGKRRIGDKLVTYLISNSFHDSKSVRDILKPILQLHVDTFERTNIKLKPNNLIMIVEDFFKDKITNHLDTEKRAS
ncbi:hypothetical protein SAMN05216480_11642 [Pustulibacterium marinum]|uniref:Uncharacterized protein n=1 Tax=Pustulibacterium marinum TaxID=1224947 RepID=A0A1I7IH58_9FLAO|nr:hypothetical protein [Pustulibacterium marinum]SFU72245.1 hypothetical protein SAMN05216480_11642 [Pustulibacterium marinum]